MHSIVRIQRQRGAVILTVCMALLFLLGFMGIAVDLGRLFIVRSELQTAMDSCALAAAQELDGVGAVIDGVTDSISRARSAGIRAGNLNRVNLQSPDWSGQGQITDADITFMDHTFTTPTLVPSAARYVECRHQQPNIKMFLLQAMGAFAGDATAFPANSNVVARAIATRGSAQTSCPLPLALKPKAGTATFVIGEWITLLMGPGAATNGQIGWANLDGSSSANETVNEMNGHCGTRVGDQLGTPGVQANVVDVWNERFGIYKTTVDESTHRPDMTGYAYTDHNWPPPAGGCPPAPASCIRNAYNGTPSSDPTGTAENFVLKREAFASCANDDPRTNPQGLHVCETITGLTLNSFQKIAAPGADATGGHREYGISRRIVLVPTVDGSNRVNGYACMLMLQPLSIPMAPVQLEYRGDASLPGSPCVTNGFPGGTAGPLVPVLVR